MAWAGVVHGPALAQTDEDEPALAYADQRSVSIAAGSRQALRKAPAVASVITAEAIRAMGAVDLDEVLESVPGPHVGRAANQHMPLYIVRGIYSHFTPRALVLQNGVPMTTRFVGNKGNAWAGHPVEHIDIVTKAAADTPGTRTGLGDGSFGTRGMLHRGKLGALDVSAHLRVGSNIGAAADAASALDAGPVDALPAGRLGLGACAAGRLPAGNLPSLRLRLCIMPPTPTAPAAERASLD